MATLRTFQKITTADADINKLQTNLSISLDPLIQLQPQAQQGITLKQGIVNIISHRLGRIPTSFSYIGYAQSDVWFSQKADATRLYLMCSADVVIDITLA